MMSPAGMAMAAITVMLWLLWSDSLRAKKPAPILYTLRIGLFLVTSAVLILNLIRYPHVFTGGSRTLAVIAAIVGILGAAYFGRRLVKRV